MLTLDNTEGFTQEQLDSMNAQVELLLSNYFLDVGNETIYKEDFNEMRQYFQAKVLNEGV